MAKTNPYKLGDQVLASRAQDGSDHEEATVVDVYSLLMSGDEIPMVVVEFSDEKRAWLKVEGPDVMPKPVEEDEDAEEADDGDEDAEPGEAEDDG